MTVSIALLRGVNVGPHRRVAMADLRAVLTAAGFGDVRTHLQSGNIVLDSGLDGAALGNAIAATLSNDLDLDTDVIVRSADELAAAIDGDPFGEIATDPARHVLGFCQGAPTAERIADLEERIARQRAAAQQEAAAQPAADDRHAFAGQHFYLWCPNGISKSPYFTVPWAKLGVASTQRNWNTVMAMLRLTR